MDVGFEGCYLNLKDLNFWFLYIDCSNLKFVENLLCQRTKIDFCKALAHGQSSPQTCHNHIFLPKLL